MNLTEKWLQAHFSAVACGTLTHTHTHTYSLAYLSLSPSLPMLCLRSCCFVFCVCGARAFMFLSLYRFIAISSTWNGLVVVVVFLVGRSVGRLSERYVHAMTFHLFFNVSFVPVHCANIIDSLLSFLLSFLLLLLFQFVYVYDYPLFRSSRNFSIELSKIIKKTNIWDSIFGVKPNKR